ncbi:hypothetical protein VCUG_00434 [Vavraia culicis subsp. floridensis]|uniref:Uncharacterized protein n=1 Tax=Vavraia culicis (isolate floridensis) TaxID=948595 RepID=L2GWG3_VAVCU|nr:uncharacterized protein VCUG_00434 [Vavraia culicis subsp. floridensis]ELA48011.1 hypothetical protein VCUG_00434 [Vavraia culicis subsp. floridensis]
MEKKLSYINEYNTAEFKLTRPVKKRKILVEKNKNKCNAERENRIHVACDSERESTYDTSEYTLSEVEASPKPEVVYIDKDDLIEIQGVNPKRYGCIRKLNFSKE